MASAGHGRLDVLTDLINMEAQINMQAKNGWTAIDFAQKQNQLEASHYLQEELAKEENIFRVRKKHICGAPLSTSKIHCFLSYIKCI